MKGKSYVVCKTQRHHSPNSVSIFQRLSGRMSKIKADNGGRLYRAGFYELI